MLRRHHGLVLDHWKSEHSQKYTNAQRPGLPEWAQEGEEFSWSSWLQRSVATARSSLPVDEWWLWMNELCTICETQHSVSMSWVALSCCSFVCSAWQHLHLSPLYEVKDHHILAENNIIWWWQWSRRRLTKRQRQRHTDTEKENANCFKDPIYAIFVKRRGSRNRGYKIWQIFHQN